MLIQYVLVSFFAGLVVAQSPLCPTDSAPRSLAAVTVWMRHENNTSVFRISDEDLTDEGFMRSPADRDNFVVLLSRDPGPCPKGTCAMKLSGNKRTTDGALTQQENVFGVPAGFEDRHDDLYCGRSIGDCGADIPIFRLTRKIGDVTLMAYSLDPAASLSGYSREALPLCFGWSDGGSIVHPLAVDSQCIQLKTVPNARITYSSGGSGAHPVGTTATLQCSNGFASGGQSSVLCTRTGWYPASGLGYCVRQNGTFLVSGSSGAGISSSWCAAAAPIINGQIIYSQLGATGRFPPLTSFSVQCQPGFVSSSLQSVVCQDGQWTPRPFPVCVSASSVKCQPMLPPLNSRISYEGGHPFSIGSLAILICQNGNVLVGSEASECTSSGWNPLLGSCQLPTLGQGLPCPAVVAIGGTPSYIQSNLTVPYSSGSSVFILCQTGFTLNGNMAAQCVNGAWTPTPGTCSQTPLANPLPGTGGLNTGSSGANCLDFPFAPNGVVTYSIPSTAFGTHPSGSSATLACNIGSTVSGVLSSNCNNGIWSPASLGTCNLQGIGNSVLECTNPVVVNGQLSYSQSSPFEPVKPVGTVATVTCNVGFSVVGIPASSCLSGQWSPPMATCQNVGMATGGLQCPSAFAVPFGAAIAYSTGALVGPFASGTTATMRCTNGALPTGASMATCLSGAWSPITLGTCPASGTTGTQCSTFTGAPIGATMAYSTGAIFGPFNEGTTTTATCPLGQTIQGTSMATCRSGQWQPATLGICGTGTGGTGMQCSTFMGPVGATMAYSTGAIFGPFNEGTTTTATCPLGQTIQGTSIATCRSGQWQPPTLGICGTGTGGIGMQCTTFMAPAGATMTYSTGAIFGPFNEGTTTTATCPMGQSIQGTSIATCRSGQWQPPTLGTCATGGSTGLQCSTFTAPIGATMGYSTGAIFGPFNEGTTATATCSVGQSIQGASIAICRSGQWQPTMLGTCVAGSGGNTGLQCTTFLAPAGATMAYSTGAIFGPFNEGTTTTATCPLGQSIQGTSMATCRSGQWQPPSLGICGIGTGGTGMQCSTFMAPAGASMSYSTGAIFGPFNEGTTTTATCPMGQSIQGTSTATCRSGQWQPPTLGVCGTGTGGSGLQCPTFTAPIGATMGYSTGAIFGPFNEGTLATATCSIGQIIQGTATTTCRSGQWQPTTLGTCVTGTGISCPFALPAPASGTINYSQGGTFGPYPSGTTATGTCTTGVTQAPTTAICSNGSWQPASLSPCTSSTGQSCVSMPPPLNGGVSYSNGGFAGPFPAGTTVTGRCNDMTQVVIGTAVATCLNGGWSPPSLGTCGSSSGGVTSQCNSMPNPVSATVTYSNGAFAGPVPVGTIATSRCTTGIMIAGSSPTSTCTAGGQWLPSSLASCSASGSANGQPCAAVAQPPNGRVDYGGSFGTTPISLPIGTQATLICNTGTPLGSAISTCTDGLWNPAIGTCQGSITGGVQCTSAPTAAFGASIIYTPSSSMWGPFQSGTTATLNCPSGQYPQGTSISTCNGGIWSPPLATMCGTTPTSGGGQCTVAPTAPFSTTLTYQPSNTAFGPWQTGTTATLTCPSGQYPQGTSMTTCNGGIWNPPLATFCGSTPTSGGAQCTAAPTAPFSTTLTYQPSNTAFGPWQSGTTATLTCPPGQYPQGTSTTTCNGGIWNPPLATFCGSTPTSGGAQCTAAPTAPFSTTLTYQPSNSVFGPWQSGTTASLTCPSGQFPQGTSTTTCYGGIWNPPLATFCGSTPTSGGAQCTAAPTAPFSTTLSYQPNTSVFGPWQSGTTATLTCPPGQYPQGTSTTTCNGGIWNPPLATFCGSTPTSGGAQCTVAPTAPFSSSLTYQPSNTPFGPWQSGTIATLTCPSGQFPQGISTTTCNGGIWNPPLATLCGSTPSGGCAPFSPVNSPLSSGQAVYSPQPSPQLTLGSTAALLCPLGSRPAGPERSVCQSTGWNPIALGQCVPQGGTGTCNALYAPANGLITYIGGTFGPFPSGTVAQAGCNSGFSMIGSPSSTCQNGLWNPAQLGTCQSGSAGVGAQCAFGLPSVTSGNIVYSNGQLFGPWPAGISASLSCNIGFSVSGTPTSQCINGNWQPTSVGTCVSGGTGTQGQCQAVPFINSGTVTYSQLGSAPFSSGTTATIVCNFGTTLTGLSRVTCQGGGWTPFPGLGSCQSQVARSPIKTIQMKPSSYPSSDETCQPPMAPPFGEITFSSSPSPSNEFPPSSSASLDCILGRSPIGPSLSFCRDGQFRPILGSCSEGDRTPGNCTPLTAPRHGKFTYIQSSSSSMLSSGSLALLVCDESFAVTGQASLRCSEDGWTPEDGFGRCDSIAQI